MNALLWILGGLFLAIILALVANALKVGDQMMKEEDLT